jgi:hypothetical protein
MKLTTTNIPEKQMMVVENDDYIVEYVNGIFRANVKLKARSWHGYEYVSGSNLAQLREAIEAYRADQAELREIARENRQAATERIEVKALLDSTTVVTVRGQDKRRRYHPFLITMPDGKKDSVYPNRLSSLRSDAEAAVRYDAEIDALNKESRELSNLRSYDVTNEVEAKITYQPNDTFTGTVELPDGEVFSSAANNVRQIERDLDKRVAAHLLPWTVNDGNEIVPTVVDPEAPYFPGTLFSTRERADRYVTIRERLAELRLLLMAARGKFDYDEEVRLQKNS